MIVTPATFSHTWLVATVLHSAERLHFTESSGTQHFSRLMTCFVWISGLHTDSIVEPFFPVTYL